MSVKWINASRSPYIPGTTIHASSLTPMVFMLIYFSWATFFLTLGVVTFMGILRTKGRSLTWLFRWLKCRMRGYQVLARPIWYRRRFSRLESIDIDGVSIEPIKQESSRAVAG